MKFGFFDDQTREYVIETPKTPFPWINYLGNEEFFGLISNTSGGYSFYKDARLRRVTRFRYNNLPLDNEGRYFYIKDGEDIWNPGWMPVKTELDFYECRHGLGYTNIKGKRNGISVDQISFVPLKFNGEVHKITIKNETSENKNIKLFSYLEWCLWNAYDDMTNFQRNYSIGEVEVEGSAIYHKTEYRERRNHYAFYWSNTPIDGYDTERDAFFGLYNGAGSPDAVKEGKASNSKALGWQPIASHYFNIDLKPQEEKEIIFVLGYVENEFEEKWESDNVINKTKAKEMQNCFETSAQVDNAINELKAYWEDLLSIYTVKSDDDKLNRMVNIWNPYQCMVTFNMSRSASYFESGIGRGMGFRDSNQDLLGFVHQIPDRARERIIDIASTQFPDGGCYHQYQPLTKKGNHDVGGGFNDDPLWLILGTSAYIKETGDFAILDEQVPFDSDPNNTATLLEHLKRSFYHVINNLGPHGLPLIGRADWNDCLNLNCFSTTPDESFQTTGDPDGRIAESIFIAGLFLYVGPDFAYLMRSKGFENEAVEAENHLVEMKEKVYKHGYDGDWFLRAYDAFGQKIGSSENKEAKIYIEPQGMCVMAELGIENGYAKKALDSVKEHLESDYGIVLNNPPYTKYDKNIGEITSYPPGYKENSGVFCHNNPWVICAETKLGRGTRAFDLYKKFTPAYIEDISEIHKTEPYVYSQMIAGKDAVKPGEAKNSWLTGTAAWTFVTISQYILGIHPHYDGLLIDPCIPADWDQYTVRRKFRGTTYIINVKNPSHVEKGIKSITVDGQAIEGNIIPVLKNHKEHIVDVILG